MYEILLDKNTRRFFKELGPAVVCFTQEVASMSHSFVGLYDENSVLIAKWIYGEGFCTKSIKVKKEVI